MALYFVPGELQEIDITFPVIGAGEIRKHLDSCIVPNILREKSTCILPVLQGYAPGL
jgi:hypothetical protein